MDETVGEQEVEEQQKKGAQQNEEKQKGEKPKKKAPPMDAGHISKIVLLVLVNLALLVLGVLILDFFDVIRLEPYLNQYVDKQFKLETEDPLEAKRRELENLKRQITYERERLKGNEQERELVLLELKEQKRLLEKEYKALAKRKDLEALERKRQEQYRQNMNKTVSALYNMPPEKAVDILALKKPEEILEILEAHEQWCEENERQSLRAYYLQLMPAKKAEEVLKLQRLKPYEG